MSSENLEYVERALSSSTISSSHSETLSSAGDVLSELYESFLAMGVGWISVFPEKWCSILQFLWCLYFFKIFYGVVVKVFVKVIMSKSPYLSALNQLFAIKLTKRFLIFFFAKFFIFCCSLFSCLILKYLRWFNYFSNKYFSTIYKCVAKILYIISRF